MLSIEETKKACEFAEGFEYHERSCSSFTITYNKSCFEIEYDSLKYSANTEIYELFLQRVIEGINSEYRKENKGYCIAEYISFLSVYHGQREVRKTEHFYSDFDTIDQAKEQAIKYILDKL